MAIEKPREIALRLLLKAARGEELLDLLVHRSLSGSGLPTRDRALIHELVFGVTRWRRLLDALLGELATQPPQGRLLEACRLGLYQLFLLSRLPDHAVVHESVALVKRVCGAAQGRFANAILRRAVRERAQLESKIEVWRREQPAIGYSFPDWLSQRWAERLSAANCQRLMEWHNTVPDVYARVNPLKTTVAEQRTAWEQEGVRFEPVPIAWDSQAVTFRVANAGKLTQGASFLAGGSYVQDPSTLLCVDWLAPQAGERVLDLCAAPGGKTGYLAERMENQGEIVACDIAEERLATLASNRDRLGWQNVKLLAIRPQYDWRDKEPFDAVLVDAPCSNTGVMRRRVELRWRLEAEEIDRLAGLQRDLLARAALAVKPGGRLVYSTCSLETEENGAVVSAFLAEHPEFELVRDRQLTPWEDAVDGAYAALLQRRN